MERKRLFLCIAIVAILITSTAYFSYAYIRISFLQTNNNTVTTLSCLEVAIDGVGSTGINLQNAYAISDAEAQSELTPYTFSITNECATPVKATIGLEELSGNTLDKEYIKYKFTYNNGAYNSPIATLDTINLEGNLIPLITNEYFGPNASKNYSLLLWIGEGATYDEAGGGKVFNSRIHVIASPTKLVTP